MCTEYMGAPKYNITQPVKVKNTDDINEANPGAFNGVIVNMEKIVINIPLKKNRAPKKR